MAEGYDEAVVRTRLALRSEGFSILTEMHVGGMLGTGTEGTRQYLIMGSWSIGGESRLGTDPTIRVGSQLPCNVVVHEQGDVALVAALDPTDEVGDDPEAVTVAVAARDALQRVLTRVATPRR